MGGINNRSGVTLVELMMVIIIMGLLAAVALPNIAPMVDMMKLRTAANTIKRQMIVARTRSLSDVYRHVGVCVNNRVTPNLSYIFFDDGVAYHCDGSDPKYFGTYDLPKGIVLSIPASGGITDSVVVFRGDGSAKNGGSIVLTNRRGKIRTVNVLASTGRVKVF